MSVKLWNFCACTTSVVFSWVYFRRGTKRADLLRLRTASASYVIGIAAGALLAGPIAETTDLDLVQMSAPRLHSRVGPCA